MSFWLDTKFNPSSTKYSLCVEKSTNWFLHKYFRQSTNTYCFSFSLFYYRKISAILKLSYFYLYALVFMRIGKLSLLTQQSAQLLAVGINTPTQGDH